ncbi:hypothetical protein CR513_02754, partial [Mucuna pruriens]
MSCFARESEINRVFFSNQLMLVLVYNEACLNSKIGSSSLPIFIIYLLQDVQDVFPVKVPSGLPFIRGIEHQIDLNPGAAFLKGPAYRNRPASWEECLPHLEFAYNKTVKSISYSPFEKTEFVRELHAKVQANIEKRNEKYARQANKGCVIVTFEPGDCVWVLRRKEKFLSEEFDSRMNPFEEGGNDRDPANKAKDPLRDTGGSLTRPRTNMMKQSLQDLSAEKMESLIVGGKIERLIVDDGKMESLIAGGKMESLIAHGKTESLIFAIRVTLFDNFDSTDRLRLGSSSSFT